MKRLLRPLRLLVALGFAPVLALAHPGHDDPHEFEWDFAHLAQHPFATVLCLAVLAASGWLAWQYYRERREEKDHVARTPDQR
jgi:hypothetical protein